jgi:hypothetical protein
MSRRGFADRSVPRCGLILCMMCLAACADESRRLRDLDSQTNADIATLVAEGSAASLATASLTSRLDADPASRSSDLIARAVAMAPDRPELIWLQWRELPDLQDAWGRQSPSEVTAAAVQVGAARHMRIYWNVLTVMMVDALAGTGGSVRHSVIGTDISTRTIYAIGII